MELEPAMGTDINGAELKTESVGPQDPDKQRETECSTLLANSTASELPSIPLHPLRGKTIIITGASTGIGRATVIETASRGAQLLLVGRRRDLLNAVAAECQRHGGKAVAVAADVAAPDTARNVIGMAMQIYGRIDGVVNNAAIARFGPLDEFSDDDVRAMFEVNLLAPLRFIREAIAPLRATRGSVVNVSSIGGVVATPRRVAYGALKAALNHLTRSLARELAPDVRVNAVLPGPVETPIYDDLGLSRSDLEGLQIEMVQTTPAGRFGQPEEVARWICELLDYRSAWVTGALVTIDGGRSS